MKKIFVLVIVAISLLAFSACGNEGAPDEKGSHQVGESSSKDNTSEEESNVKGSEDDTTMQNDFSQRISFLGYDFGCPQEAALLATSYGNMFTYEKCGIFIEAPSSAGVMLDVSEIKDSATICQEYVIKSLERSARALFAAGQTEQHIDKSTTVTVNEIEMLRVEGTFKNTKDNTSISYVAYYFLGGPAGNRPVYAVGIGMDETASIQEFMDEFAQQIKK